MVDELRELTIVQELKIDSLMDFISHNLREENFNHERSDIKREDIYEEQPIQNMTIQRGSEQESK